MRNAYALLGLSFLIVFGAAYLLLSNKVEAPTAPAVAEETNEPATTTEMTE